ncbi:uncharacterized protein PSFLO_04189 [Pseudozyma flocculosa]|uniref:Uncharacterized protein n=1 Tax=Pseudozyma flocculosa TaxID=84751 RepID=A0A5C3F3M9_9BASI|nr:uncharacterized protein PSFLO_04189 [Pseudozyma flocculosa]
MASKRSDTRRGSARRPDAPSLRHPTRDEAKDLEHPVMSSHSEAEDEDEVAAVGGNSQAWLPQKKRQRRGEVSTEHGHGGSSSGKASSERSHGGSSIVQRGDPSATHLESSDSDDDVVTEHDALRKLLTHSKKTLQIVEGLERDVRRLKESDALRDMQVDKLVQNSERATQEVADLRCHFSSLAERPAPKSKKAAEPVIPTETRRAFTKVLHKLMGVKVGPAPLWPTELDADQIEEEYTTGDQIAGGLFERMKDPEFDEPFSERPLRINWATYKNKDEMETALVQYAVETIVADRSGYGVKGDIDVDLIRAGCLESLRGHRHHATQLTDPKKAEKEKKRQQDNKYRTRRKELSLKRTGGLEAMLDFDPRDDPRRDSLKPELVSDKLSSQDGSDGDAEGEGEGAAGGGRGEGSSGQQGLVGVHAWQLQSPAWGSKQRLQFMDKCDSVAARTRGKRGHSPGHALARPNWVVDPFDSDPNFKLPSSVQRWMVAEDWKEASDCNRKACANVQRNRKPFKNVGTDTWGSGTGKPIRKWGGGELSPVQAGGGEEQGRSDGGRQ